MSTHYRAQRAFYNFETPPETLPSHLYIQTLWIQPPPIGLATLTTKIDKRIAVQLLYHTIAAMKSVDDEECKEFCKNKTVLKLANQFHRVNECGKL